jgi:hypothetical protein
MSSSTPLEQRRLPFVSADVDVEPPNGSTNISTEQNLKTWTTADGVTEAEFTFLEEPLGVSVDDGYGYADIQFGQLLRDRYRVVRKLGWGMNSSVWLARDEQYVFHPVQTTFF